MRVGESGVWAVGIVLDAPLFDDDLGFTQRVENLPIEAFVAQLAVETFTIATSGFRF